MKTKIICLLLAMVMVIGMLVSCGGGGDNTGNNGGNTGDNGGNTGDNGGNTGNNGGNTGDNGGNTGDNGDSGVVDGGGDSEDFTDIGGPTYNTYWKQTPIIYELTEASDAGQFTAGTRRYYAGGDTASTKVIDVNIRNRNGTAAKRANVKINYQYLADITTNDWSRSVETIFKNSTNYVAGKSVDIYCNFAYDLTGATAKGCFANLFSNTDKSTKEYGAGNNYFKFTQEGYKYESENYFDSKVGEGYFFQYMQSLTLSNDKMYVLGSDYCTDLVRAFHVVPVNIELMNNIDPDVLAMNLGADYDPDLTNIQNFYELVWAGKWNYDTMLKFSTAVYSNTAGSPAGADISDTLGFAITGGGLPASGILYTSTVQILNKELLTAERKAQILADTSDDTVENGVTIDTGLAEFIAGDYLVTYPDKNADFTAYADALNNLFEQGKAKGVCFVDSTDSANNVRSNFVGGKILFGSIIALGSLEDNDYQGMRAGSGFGIVPVPVYKTGDDYQTFVHNNARVLAIAVMTDRFEQISAYLDFQSRQSSEILQMYYNNELAQSLQGETGDDNAQMLTYIRNHVRNVFDKTYEDVMGIFNKSTDASADLRRWHEIIRLHNYQVTSMGTLYDERIPEKKADLKAVIDAWNALQ